MTTSSELVSLAVRGTTQQSAPGDYQSADDINTFANYEELKRECE